MRALVAIGLSFAMLPATLLTALAGGPTTASWTQFRYGPSHTGFNPHETTLTPATVGALMPLWQTGPGGVYTDPAVANGLDFLTGRRNGQCSGFEALSAQTGKVKWSHSLKAFRCTDPAVSGKYVVLLTRNPLRLSVWRAATGKRVWSATMPPGRYSSPTVSAGIVYVAAPNGYVMARRVRDGLTHWVVKLHGPLTSEAPAVTGGRLYITSQSGKVFALGLRHGHVLWTVSSGVPAQTQDATVAVAGGQLFVSSNLNTMYAVNLSRHSIAWKSSDIQFTPDFAVAYGLIYVATAPQGPHGQGPNVFALSQQTGKVQWQFTGGFFASGPEAAGGVLYVSTDGPAGTGTLFALNAKTGAKLWSGPGAGSYPSYPAIVNGRVYVNNRCYGLPK